MTLNNQDLDMARLHPDVLFNRKAKGYIGTIIAALRRLLVALGGKYVSSDDTDVVLVEKIADLAENGGISPSVLTGGGGNYQNIWYATCTTATGTADKVATSTTGDFVLATGNMCVVNFTHYNNQTEPYLSVDGCTKKRIKERSGTGQITTALWRDGESVLLAYDGTDFIVSDGGTASTTYYGVTKLSNSYMSTSQSLAATSQAVKSVYDIAIAKPSLSDIYPVGSIYMSVNSANPGTLFGGTWEQIENKFLLAAGSIYTAGDTGGEATHVLTTDEMPSHNHGFKRTTEAVSSGSNYARISSTGDAVTDLITNTGGGQAHNNMPPYLAVYVWKRTA